MQIFFGGTRTVLSYQGLKEIRVLLQYLCKNRNVIMYCDNSVVMSEQLCFCDCDYYCGKKDRGGWGQEFRNLRHVK